MNKCQKRLITGTMILGTASATVPMAGCEPVTTTAVVAVIAFEAIALMIAEGAVSYVVYKVGEAIFIEIKSAFNGNSTHYEVELKPGDLLEVQEDGTLLMHQ